MSTVKQVHNVVEKILFDIDNLSTPEFIIYAKKYNIFKISHSKFYDFVCNKIKARLDREGLSYDTVKPD